METNAEDTDIFKDVLRDVREQATFRTRVGRGGPMDERGAQTDACHTDGGA